jgi:hypothetical protein
MNEKKLKLEKFRISLLSDVYKSKIIGGTDDTTNGGNDDGETQTEGEKKKKKKCIATSLIWVDIPEVDPNAGG